MTAPTVRATTLDRPAVSTWTRLALIATPMSVCGAIAGPSAGTMHPGVSVFALAVATVAVMQEQRPMWRYAAMMAALVSLSVYGTHALTMTALSL
jgi:hypothetical protein